MSIPTFTGYNPILVITRIDDVEEPDENRRLRQEIIDRVPVNEADIFFHKNYVQETHRDIKIDLSTRRILRAINDRYKNHYLAAGKSHWEDVNWDLRSVLKPSTPGLCDNSQQMRTKKENDKVKSKSSSDPDADSTKCEVDVEVEFEGKTKSYSLSTGATFERLLNFLGRKYPDRGITSSAYGLCYEKNGKRYFVDLDLAVDSHPSVILEKN